MYVGDKSRAYYDHYNFPRERLFFSPHCVDTHFFAQRSGDAVRRATRDELGISQTTSVILFSGKLIDRKRPIDVVNAVARVRKERPDTVLAIAGSGPLEDDICREADRLDVPVHLLGFCNQSKMPAVYAAADVLCLPSQIETWGLVCNEALACGTPIVVSDLVGCAPDLAADSCVGYTVPVGNCAALAKALTSVLNDPPPSHKIAALSERYSIAAAVEGIAGALDAIVNSTSKRGC